MSKAIRILAIAALVVTIAGAGAVLYGLNTLVPAAERVTATAIPAAQAQQTFEDTLAQVAQGTFAGHVFAPADGLSMEGASFVTVNLRLKNRGFFPAEWIALSVIPRENAPADARDVLQLDNYGANVLAPGSQGDISATVLTTIEPELLETMPLTLEVSCYVLGAKRSFQITAP
ncbi:MAG: hypothetical protein ACI4PG_02495 [Candidatus Ventricola sp.]